MIHANHFAYFARTIVAMAALAATLSASAHEHSHEHSGEGAHVHGVVALDVALDGHDVALALHAPLADVVGFEHAPSTEEQRAQVAVAKAKLTDATELFKFPAAAQCKLESVSLEAPVLGWADGGAAAPTAPMQAAEHTHSDGHKDAHDEGHDHDHDHGKKEESGHDHEHSHDHEHAHADLDANFLFHCENAQALQQIDVQLFKGFHTINTINVQTATQSKQTKQELHAQSTVIRLEN